MINFSLIDSKLYTLLITSANELCNERTLIFPCFYFARGMVSVTTSSLMDDLANLS